MSGRHNDSTRVCLVDTVISLGGLMLDDRRWPQLASVLKEGPSDTRGGQRWLGSDVRLSQRSRASVVREGQRRGTATGEETVRHRATKLKSQPL